MYRGKGRNRPEDALQRSVVSYLDAALPRRALWWAALQNPRSKVDGARLKAMGLRAGIPDLLIYYDQRLVGIELKAPKGRVSDSQTEVAAQLQDNGGWWSCCRSIEDVEHTLNTAGIPLMARAA